MNRIRSQPAARGIVESVGDVEMNTNMGNESEKKMERRKPMKDRVALVTGGSGGIGRAISYRLSIAGASVIILGRNQVKGKSVVKSIVSYNERQAKFYRTDLAKDKEIVQTVHDVIEEFGRIDILVNNAAISGYMGPVVETPIKELRKVMQVNLFSIFYLSRLVLPKMIENNFGRIINISSVAYRKNTPNSATYNISKAGLNTLTRTLSKEVAMYGITVNAVAPGLVLTDRIIKCRLPIMASKVGVTSEEMLRRLTAGTDTGHLTTEDDVAQLVMFLASDHSQNITGEIIDISGGL